MSIIINDSDLTPEDLEEVLEYVECPGCDGDGIDEEGNDCQVCYGSGKITVDELNVFMSEEDYEDIMREIEEDLKSGKYD
jgi:RecJ-like exonuclease